jgi:DeoR/GlpR family transcriptional regulator of sugar metabolism
MKSYYIERMGSKQNRYMLLRNVDDKEEMQVEQKKQIAEEALKYISNSDYIILGSGSNIHYLSRIKRFSIS